MAVTRKVQSKVTKVKPEEKVDILVEEKKTTSRTSERVEEASEERGGKSSSRPKRGCQFCKTNSVPRHWDASAIRRYLNDRGRIYSRTRSGCCAKHQRRLSQEIKRARHLALLPFTVRV